MGYQDEIEMLEDISANYDIVVEQDNGRLMLVKQKGANRYGIVELREGDDAYYGYTTTYNEGSKNIGKPGKTSLDRQLTRASNRILWHRR